MNAFNKERMKDGLTECCDNCNAEIYNWKICNNGIIQFDGKVFCYFCDKEKKVVDKQEN